MAKAAGRKAILSKNGTPIAGIKVTSIKWGGEGIDVTDQNSSGIREFLNGVDLSSQTLTIECEGIESDHVLRDIAMTIATNKMLTDLSSKFADALAAKDTITGNFLLTSYEESNPDDEAADFKATFESSGAWVVA
jgi:predicted secreted protein